MLGFAPGLLFGLIAGVWTDRLRRRSILITTDLLRGVLVLSVPLGAWLGVLHIEQLYVVEFLAGTAVVFSQVAGPAYLPSLVGREQLVEANARLSTSGSVVRVAGPSVAGVLVQLVTAPVALLADAASFAFSAACLQLIRKREPAGANPSHRGAWNDVRAGLSAVLRDPLLCPLSLATCAYNFFAAIFETIYMLFLVRDLGLSAAVIGVVLAGSGFGAVLGGLVSSQIAVRFGIGRAILSGALVLAMAHVVAPLVVGPEILSAPLLFSAGLVANVGGLIMAVNRQTLIQHLTPDKMLGRVFASQRFLTVAALPFGALLGGVLGEALGPRGALAVVAIGMNVSMALLLLTPVRGLRELPVAEPSVG